MKNLNGLLERVIKYMDRADAFLSDQIPEFCKQLMAYSAWETQWSYDIAFWFTLLFFLICIACVVKLIAAYNPDGEIVATLVCCGIVFLISFAVTVDCYKDLKMYKMAPKVYLVNTVKNMMVKN